MSNERIIIVIMFIEQQSRELGPRGKGGRKGELGRGRGRRPCFGAGLCQALAGSLPVSHRCRAGARDAAPAGRAPGAVTPSPGARPSYQGSAGPARALAAAEGTWGWHQAPRRPRRCQAEDGDVPACGRASLGARVPARAGQPPACSRAGFTLIQKPAVHLHP